MIDNFEKIKEKIETLIGICSSLKKKNSELEDEKKNLKKDIDELQKKEKEFLEQQNFLKEKINKLLNKLDEFLN